jgi:hypothetical protein
MLFRRVLFCAGDTLPFLAISSEALIFFVSFLHQGKKENKLPEVSHLILHSTNVLKSAGTVRRSKAKEGTTPADL